MKDIGVISKDIITKNRIISALKEQDYNVTVINGAIFDENAFDYILLDLNDPMADLIIKNYAKKIIAFGSASDDKKLKMAKDGGSYRVYKNGEFFKKILLNFKL